MKLRAVLLVLVVSCSEHVPDEEKPLPPGEPCPDVASEEPLPPAGTAIPRWAFEPWISKDISNRDDTYAFVDGFRERGIPVGAVVLDSPWETYYNTFVPNPTRYGDFPDMVKDMHDRGVRVVLWITAATNKNGYDFEPGGDLYPGPAPNLERGEECGFFIDDGYQYPWWKGAGAFVDFFNPRTRTWWHEQQNGVLDAGIDGWKLDFAESYIRQANVKTADGEKTLQQYSERYYQDYLAYGRKRRGPDFLTMVRAWDESYDFAGRFFAKKEDAPISWMGDNTRDYPGLVDALEEMFVSAGAGYSVLGSDIGGYLDKSDKELNGPQIPFDSVNFARWVATGALCPFMELHGRANLTPWTVPDHADETVALYKYWARLHHALVPFLADRVKGTDPLMTFLGRTGDYRWLLGKQLLVAPLLDATGKRDVALPAGSRWYDWWTTDLLDGGTTVSADFSADRAKLPLYVREGAILPLTVDDPEDVLGLGGGSAKGVETYAVWPGGKTSYGDLTVDEGASEITLTVGGAARPVLVTVHQSKKSVAVVSVNAPGSVVLVK